MDNLNYKISGNKPKLNLFEKKDKIKNEIFSVLDNKTITRTQSSFQRPKQISQCSYDVFSFNKNTSNNSSTIFNTNKITTISFLNPTKKTIEGINNNYNPLENSFEKLNHILSNYYEERKKQQQSKANSFSKTTDYIKRFKNRFEKGVKLIPIEKEFKKTCNFTRSSGLFESKRPKSSVVDNWNKFDKKQVGFNSEFTNSDILRLELINLNCYSNNEIEQLKGIDTLNVKNKKRTGPINQL